MRTRPFWIVTAVATALVVAAAASRPAAQSPAPSHRSEPAFTIAERDLIPEGLAYDPVTRAFFVSSIYRRKIVRVDASGRAADFAAPKQDGLMSVLGLRVDPSRRILWAAVEGSESMIDAAPSERGRSAVFKYDLRSGRLLQSYWTNPGPQTHLFNDLVIDSSGNLLVTDSEEGSLYSIAAGSNRLERVLGPAAWRYPNGITLSADERQVYIAHESGIALVDRASWTSREVAHEPGITLAGLDGIYREGRSLVAVQNDARPVRIVQFTLDDGGARVVTARTLEEAHPAFDIPTTGAIVDGWFYYIANSQLGAFSRDHQIVPEKLRDVVILKVPLYSS